MTDSGARDRIVVVGAGVIGIACAHYLNRAGFPVTVIDQGRLAGGCSHGNCGYICPSHVLPLTEPGAIGTALKSLFQPQAPFRIKPRFSPAFWNWMWQFARRCHHRQMLTAGAALKAILDAAHAEYQQLMRDESLDCEWAERGLLYVLQTSHGWQEFAATDRLLSAEFGITARRISGSELPEFDPALKAGLAGAFLYEGDASLRPDLLNSRWIARLQQRGVRFIEDCALQGIRRTADRVDRIATSQGELQVGQLVIAAGALSARLANMLDCRIPVEPGKGYSVTMERPAICPKFPMLFPEHRVGVSPFENGYRLGSMMEFAGFDTSIPDARIQQLRDSAAPYLVDPVGPGRQETWYGWRPMTWDSLPIIGAVPRLSNAWLATGHNMLGMSLATSTGRLISELIQGQAPHVDPAPYSPARF